MSCRCPAWFHLAPTIQRQAKLPSASPLASRTFFLRADFFSWSFCKEPRICLVLYSCTSRLGCLGWSISLGQVQDSKEFHDGMPCTDSASSTSSASPRERLDSPDSPDSLDSSDSASGSGVASMWQTSMCGFAMQRQVIKSTSEIMSLTNLLWRIRLLFSQRSCVEHAIRISSRTIWRFFKLNIDSIMVHHRIGSILLSSIQTSWLQTNLITPAISKYLKACLCDHQQELAWSQNRTQIRDMVTNWNSWIEPCQLRTLRNGTSDLLGSLLM